MRTAKIERKTNETQIVMELNIDSRGKSEINTGIGFFDHMLNLFAFHGDFDLKLICQGDLNIDEHHSVEDIGIVLGQTFKKALADRKGIQRYSSIYIPMDEALCHVTIDISNRPYLVFNVDFKSENLLGFLSNGVNSVSKVTAVSLANPSTARQSGRLEVISNSMISWPIPITSKALPPIGASSGNT